MLTENAKKLLKERYCHQNEQPKDVYPRVANALSLGDTKFEKKLVEAMENGIFLPNSPCLRNAGLKKSMLHACFVLQISDSMDSISDTLKDMIIIFKHGGGIGINFSTLRAKDSALSSGGKSSGVVSFMGLFDKATEIVKQGGFRRGACVTSTAQALTKKGWKFWNELMVGDEILTFNPEKEMGEFQPILKLNTFDYNGTILNFKNKFMDFSFTPDHRVIYKSNSKVKKTYSIASAEQLPSHDIFIPMASSVPSDKKDYPISDDFIKIMAWIITEGSRHDPKNRNKNAFDIWQNREVHPENCKELDTLWIKLGWKFTNNGKDGRWYVPASKTRDILKLEYNHKIIPQWVLENFSCRQLYILFETLMKGDGHRQKTWGKFSCKDELGAERFLTLCVLLGFRCKMKKVFNSYITKNNEQSYCHDISINFQKKCSTLNKNERTKTIYTGKVWCPTVENGFWFVKNNGYVSITGNCMGVLNFEHAEILEFIRSKLTNQLTNFNISVLVSDKFMEKVEKGENIDLINPADNKVLTTLNAKTIFDVICFCAWNSGDPGLLFYDRINKDNSLFPKIKIKASNPCGETPLPPYGACCLGSINISKLVKNNKFNFKEFEKYLVIAVRALRNMNAVSWYPLPQITKVMKELDPIGIGIMGFADCLIKLGILYDSEDAIKFIDELGKVYKEVTDKLAPNCFYRRIIAPTGSLSILADCSSGIEPIFETSFERHLTVGIIQETREIYKSKYVRTAYQVSPDWHLRIQAQWQKWVDGSISKTINLPSETSVETVKNIYLQAWKSGCKGITIFRESSKEGAWKKKPKCEGDSCQL